MATSTAALLRVVEPATEEVLAELPHAGVEETDAAVARAKAAFAEWRAATFVKRLRECLRLLRRSPENTSNSSRRIGCALRSVSFEPTNVEPLTRLASALRL